MWCVSVPSSYFVARRNGKAFITGNSGFPKGSDVSKHIDRYYDAEDERETYPNPLADKQTGQSDTNAHGDRSPHDLLSKPATSEAEQWDGWRSQLKPATEFAVLARAPMSESAVYRNVLEHGTGALNIDRTRIPHNDPPIERLDDDSPCGMFQRNDNENGGAGPSQDGRYPANLLLDGVASRMLDEQSGSSKSPDSYERSVASGNVNVYGDTIGDPEGAISENYGDEGGASRFFYTAKASKSERTINGQIDNEHPTVKPLDLMEWLVTLVTAPGQRVLDPFAGSGTTIMACCRLNREGIGIEKDAEHAALARKRVELAHELETERVPATEDTAESDDADDTDEPATLESFADADDD